MTTVAIPLYEGFTALDVVGPYQMLAMTPGVRVTLVAERTGGVLDDRESLTLQATASFADVTDPDIVVVPGGPGTEQNLSGAVPEWVARVHAKTTWTTSVCSGSLILAAAGLLIGIPAACHYIHLPTLGLLGGTPSPERVVEAPESRIITAAGVSSGIDMALRLVELLVDQTAAEAMQLMIEYDPQPPFSAGSLDKAGDHVVERIAEYAALRS